MNRVVVSALVSGLLCAGVSSPAWAQYKVVGPDGRVTYTDRPPVDRPSQAVKSSGTAAGSVPLPYTLRNVVARYPVTLYTSEKCNPCNSARELLQKRGVPFTEKTITTAEDGQAFAALGAENALPLVTIDGEDARDFDDAVFCEAKRGGGWRLWVEQDVRRQVGVAREHQPQRPVIKRRCEWRQATLAAGSTPRPTSPSPRSTSSRCRPWSPRSG